MCSETFITLILTLFRLGDNFQGTAIQKSTQTSTMTPSTNYLLDLLQGHSFGISKDSLANMPIHAASAIPNKIGC